MKYKVTFRKRFTPEGASADEPTAQIDAADGVIQDAELVEIIEPANLTVTENLNSEDDGFLGFGTETWVYDVADGRDQEFKDAMVNTELVLDIEEVPDESLTT